MEDEPTPISATQVSNALLKTYSALERETKAGLRPATAADYADFLIKYLNESHVNKVRVSSIPFAEVQENMKVVTSDGSIPLEKGEFLDVIIPKDLFAGFGENRGKGGEGRLYNMGLGVALGHKVWGTDDPDPIVWLYDDVAREMVNKGWEFEKEHFETSRNKLLLPRNNLSRVQKWIKQAEKDLKKRNAEMERFAHVIDQGIVPEDAVQFLAPPPFKEEDQAVTQSQEREYTQPEVHAVEYSGDMAAYYGRETIFGRELLAQGQVDKDKNPHGLWEYFKEPADRQFAFFNNGEGIASAPSMDALTALPEVQAALGLMPNPTAEYFNNAMKQVAQRRPPSAAAALEQVAQIRPEQALLPVQPKPAEDMVQTQEAALKVEI
jgi:hypothetical protein